MMVRVMKVMMLVPDFLQRRLQAAFGFFGAFAALAGDAEFVPEVFQGMRATGHGFPDLPFGDGFADADVHR